MSLAHVLDCTTRLSGRCGCTTNGYGDYLEHCGGLVLAYMGSVFGVDFDSGGTDATATANATWYIATVAPRFPKAWGSASATTYLRGSPLIVSWEHSASSPTGTLTLLRTATADGSGPPASLPVRVLNCGVPSVVLLLLGTAQRFVGCDVTY